MANNSIPKIIAKLETMIQRIDDPSLPPPAWVGRPPPPPHPPFVPNRMGPPFNASLSVHVARSKEEFYRLMGVEFYQVPASLRNAPRRGHAAAKASRAREKEVHDELVTKLEKMCGVFIGGDYIRALTHPSKEKVLAVATGYNHLTNAKKQELTNKGVLPAWDGPWRYFVIRNKAFAIGRLLDVARFGCKIFFIELICKMKGAAGGERVIGSMLHRIEKTARAEGCTKLWLASVVGATSAYRRRGFQFGPVVEHDTAYPPGARVVTKPYSRPAQSNSGYTMRNGTPIMHPRPMRDFVIKYLGPGLSNHVNGHEPDQTYLMSKCIKAGCRVCPR